MKKSSKFFSVALALMLVFAMALPFFAVDTWTGSITIESAEHVSVDGKTFNAYKLLDAEAVNANDLSEGVIYKLPSGPSDLLAYYNTNFGGTDNVATVDEVVAAIGGTNFDLNAFAEAVYPIIKDETAVGTAQGANGKATIENLAFGYYLIEDAGSATPISALMLRTTAETIKIKADKPTIEKKIDGTKDSDTTTTTLTDYNTAKVGDKVPYILKSYVPDTTGYTTYKYIVKDTFSAGLDYVENSVKVTIGGTAYTPTVKYEGKLLTIDFGNLVGQTKNAEIVITYEAIVNASAEFGVEGNPNEVVLEYSNNPTDETKTETTTKDIVRTYLVDLVINKTDDDSAPLANAEFALKDNTGKVLATGKSDDKGLVTFTWTEAKGLRDGETYTISETKAPAGYNAAADITFTVTCTDPAAPETKCVWAGSNGVTYDSTDDRLETTIVNKTGSLLPETGGIGTTIFYIVGGLLVFGAAVLLITKKRMACEA